MRNAGPVSVNEISRATGLSKMTVHKIIDHYIHEGMVTMVGKGVSTEEGGKKPNLFSFNPNCRYIFAIRLAGNELCTSIVNLKGESIVDRRWEPVAGLGHAEVMELIGKAFTSQVHDKGLLPENCLAAVLGCNGIVDADKGVGIASFQHPAWEFDVPLRESLAKQIPQNIPIHLDSWWRHIAHGEMSSSPTPENARFFLIGNSGDYVSGGLVADGKVCRGASGFAGDIGHMVVDPRCETTCVCGGSGCLESLIAPGRVAERVLGLKDEFPDSLLFGADRKGAEDSIADVAAAAERGDALGGKIVGEIVNYLATAINNIIHICDPGMVVLFGSYASAGEKFLERLRERVGALTLRGIDKRTKIVPSNLDEQSGIVGAAHFITDTLFAGSV